MVPPHGETAAPIADTLESMLTFSVRISTSLEEHVKSQTEVLLYADVLDWVKSETGAEEACPPPPTTTTPLPTTPTTPQPSTCYDSFCSFRCYNADECMERRSCRRHCRKHCNDEIVEKPEPLAQHLAWYCPQGACEDTYCSRCNDADRCSRWYWCRKHCMQQCNLC